MRDLGLDGLSEDKRFLIVHDPASGESFRVPAPTPNMVPGQLEITMQSSLSPRDIQTRIRRGESPQSVADSAGVKVDQISGFAGPVLAERDYMCEQARQATVRRKHVGGTGILLGTLVTEGIVASGSVPETAAWDSWRQEDGRWVVVVTPRGAVEPATFLFDAKSRYVVPADDRARQLVGDMPLGDAGDMAIADAVRSPDRETNREVVPDPVIEIDEITLDEETAPGVSSLKEARDRRALEQLALGDIEELRDDEADEAHAADAFDEAVEHDVAVPDTAAPRKKRHERRRVPSWDEIMFGEKSD